MTAIVGQAERNAKLLSTLVSVSCLEFIMSVSITVSQENYTVVILVFTPAICWKGGGSFFQ